MSRTDDGNDFADLSGATSSTSDNPYDTLIDACVNDPVKSTLGA